jgi:hypothetical protein
MWLWSSLMNGPLLFRKNRRQSKRRLPTETHDGIRSLPLLQFQPLTPFQSLPDLALGALVLDLAMGALVLALALGALVFFLLDYFEPPVDADGELEGLLLVEGTDEGPEEGALLKLGLLEG